MDELIHKCSRNACNPTTMTWLMAVEMEVIEYEEFIVLGCLYKPSCSSMENKILEGLEKIIVGEFKRQVVDHLRDKWPTLNAVNLLTGGLEHMSRLTALQTVVLHQNR